MKAERQVQIAQKNLSMPLRPVLSCNTTIPRAIAFIPKLATMEAQCQEQIAELAAQQKQPRADLSKN
jgi:hypothetical protein